MDLNNVLLADIILPFYVVTGILVVLAVFLFLVPLPEVKAAGEEEDSIQTSNTTTKTSVFQYPHLILGAIALLVYIGVETLPMVSII